MKRFVPFIAGATFIAALGIGFQIAHGLSNPITGGKPAHIDVTTTPQRIPATGQKCNLIISCLDPLTRKFPVYTGLASSDGGAWALVNDGQPICDNTLPALTGCINTWVSRDYVPDAIWVRTAVGASPDGGVRCRLEMGTGCTQP